MRRQTMPIEEQPPVSKIIKVNRAAIKSNDFRSINAYAPNRYVSNSYQTVKYFSNANAYVPVVKPSNDNRTINPKYFSNANAYVSAINSPNNNRTVYQRYCAPAHVKRNIHNYVEYPKRQRYYQTNRLLHAPSVMDSINHYDRESYYLKYNCSKYKFAPEPWRT